MDNDQAGRWDAAAEDYQKVFLQGQNEYNQALFRFWEAEGMLRPGCRVLDIGCGVGKYGVAFAQRGCDVTLLDISPVMLSHAEKNMAPFATPWRTWRCDFSEVSGREAVFSQGFDLSISTMSGAVHDVDTAKKMSGMTHGWCFLSRFSAWEEPLRRRLMEAAGFHPASPMGDMEADCAAVTDAVSEAGYRPRVRTVDYNWADLRSPEEMADYMLRRYIENLSEREKWHRPLIEAAQKACGSDGFVNDAVQTKVLWIWWETENTQNDR